MSPARLFITFCRWRFVTHAGVDGYSRIPVYCYCSDNNRADTVLEQFLKAVAKYGLPSRVRCDRGTENYKVAYFMLNHPQRGTGRGSVIAGRSVHNQRVERFWRDLFVSCVSLFYHLFYHLEETNLLDATNDVDLFSLHFVYQPYINYCMRLFIDAWCTHPLRSCGNLTPMQLWISGMLTNAASGTRVTDELYNDTRVSFLPSLPCIYYYPTRKIMASTGMVQFLKQQMKALKSQVSLAPLTKKNTCTSSRCILKKSFWQAIHMQ